jgi:hypothetical protein
MDTNVRQIGVDTAWDNPHVKRNVTYVAAERVSSTIDSLCRDARCR